MTNFITQTKEVAFLDLFFNSVFLAFTSVGAYAYIIIFTFLFFGTTDVSFSSIPGRLPHWAVFTFFSILFYVIATIPVIIGGIIAIVIDITRNFKRLKFLQEERFNINICTLIIIRIVNIILSFIFILFNISFIPLTIIGLLHK